MSIPVQIIHDSDWDGGGHNESRFMSGLFQLFPFIRMLTRNGSRNEEEIITGMG